MFVLGSLPLGAHLCYAFRMTPATQSWLQVITLIAALGGFFAWQTHYIDKRIDDLRRELKAEIAGLRDELKAEIAGLRNLVSERFRHVEARLERLEHPVARP